MHRKSKLNALYQPANIAIIGWATTERVFIARSLAQQANLYLMDEPFPGVDANSEDQILQLLQTMRNEGKTIVVVHHDLQTAQAYFHMVFNAKYPLSGCRPYQRGFYRRKFAKNLWRKIKPFNQNWKLSSARKLPHSRKITLNFLKDS